MITQISGRLVEKNPTYVIVDCNGLGYFLHISLHTYSKLSNDENVLFYTHLQVREDAHTLYGFFDKNEREVFRLLLSVSGVGASTARTMLSSMSATEVKQAIVSEDVKLIQSVKGIGLKTAQRVIIDLKDKVLKIFDFEEEIAGTNNTSKEEALSALEVLGFNRKQTDKLVSGIVTELPDATVEVIIKMALKKL